MNQIIEYLEEKYRPLGIIVYGSFADGTNGPGSDFDAIVITESGSTLHDSSLIDGIVLDVFVYTKEDISGMFNPAKFIAVLEGHIIKDTDDGISANLKTSVNAWLMDQPLKKLEENRCNVEWCEKMLFRAARNDAEGFFRWHWLLTDSLEFCFDLIEVRYLGPKKSLRYLEKNRPELAAVYETALKTFCYEDLAAWVTCLRQLLEASV